MSYTRTAIKMKDNSSKLAVWPPFVVHKRLSQLDGGLVLNRRGEIKEKENGINLLRRGDKTGDLQTEQA